MVADCSTMLIGVTPLCSLGNIPLERDSTRFLRQTDDGRSEGRSSMNTLIKPAKCFTAGSSQFSIMHLSMSCPTYPRSGRGWGFVGDCQIEPVPRVGAFVIRPCSSLQCSNAYQQFLIILYEFFSNLAVKSPTNPALYCGD